MRRVAFETVGRAIAEITAAEELVVDGTADVVDVTVDGVALFDDSFSSFDFSSVIFFSEGVDSAGLSGFGRSLDTFSGGDSDLSK